MRKFASMQVLVALITCIGCGESGPPVPVYPVSGKVTLNGKPVSGADLVFYNHDAGRSSFGRTNDQGEYQLTTFSSNDGAIEGKYVVTVSKIEPPKAPPKPIATTESEAYVPPGMNQSTDPPRPKSTFPGKFGNAETSGLMAVVSPDAPNTVDFDLKD